jgi:hypothetical protein
LSTGTYPTTRGWCRVTSGRRSAVCSTTGLVPHRIRARLRSQRASRSASPGERLRMMGAG